MIGPLAYIGGKRRVATQISRLIPEHTTYVEPFSGGAQVFFHKRPSRVEVLNDLDGEIVNFLRVCQQHPRELVRVMRYWIASRGWHAALAAQATDHLTDIQRAARLLYLQKNSFGGLVRRQTFHYCVTKPSNYNPTRLRRLIETTASRLARVQLECWPYERVLERYDRPSTFFYIDPPYVGLSLYRFNLTNDDFPDLAERLRALRGKFLLSLNDHPVARAAFQGFAVRELSVSYTSTPHVPTVRELLFSNF